MVFDKKNWAFYHAGFFMQTKVEKIVFSYSE